MKTFLNMHNRTFSKNQIVNWRNYSLDRLQLFILKLSLCKVESQHIYKDSIFILSCINKQKI